MPNWDDFICNQLRVYLDCGVWLKSTTPALAVLSGAFRAPLCREVFDPTSRFTAVFDMAPSFEAVFDRNQRFSTHEA